MEKKYCEQEQLRAAADTTAFILVFHFNDQFSFHLENDDPLKHFLMIDSNHS